MADGDKGNPPTRPNGPSELLLRNIFGQGELRPQATVAESPTVRPAGDRALARNSVVVFFATTARLGFTSPSCPTPNTYHLTPPPSPLSERDILTHTGAVSHEAALTKAHAEYDKFRALLAAGPSPVEQHFQEAVEHVKQLQDGPIAPGRGPSRTRRLRPKATQD